MRKTTVIFNLILFVVLALPELAAANNSASPRHVPDEVIVHFKTSTTHASRGHSLARRGHRKLGEVGGVHIMHVKLAPNESVDSALRFYENDPDVEFVQPNYIYSNSVFVPPTDPLYSQQWAFKNTGQTIVSPGGPGAPDSTNGQPNGGTSGDDMSMEGAWAISTDCSSVIIAVVDTGVNYNHEDLAGNMWMGLAKHGKDFVGTGAGGAADPMDQNGHGTHVAGIIAAQANNGKGGVGVCWTAQIMAVRVLNSSGIGTTADITNGVNFAVANGAKVINMSLGGSNFDPTFSASITAAYNAGVVVVVAAGNDSINVNGAIQSYPCNFSQKNIICVAALNQSNGLAYYSNYGIGSVHVGAPGSNIVSSWIGTTASITDNLSAGWTLAGAWGYTAVTVNSLIAPFNAVLVNMLANPSTWNGSNKYLVSANDKAYKSFNIAGVNLATVKFNPFVDVAGAGSAQMNYKATGGDPFTGGTSFYSTGAVSSGLVSSTGSYDITPCISATCSIGFKLVGDGVTSSFGIGIFDFSIETLIYSPSSYNVIEGTSMATPYVAGIAALVAAYNPLESVDQIVNTVKASGVSLPSLSGKTTTGKGVNAWNAMTYIAPPTYLSFSYVLH